MKWITPKFTKTQVKRAGEYLTSPNTLDPKWEECMEILSNWRGSHAYPMHALLIFLRGKSSEIDSSSIVVQRLKRTPSIIHKLERFPGMNLDRMQDISGCRSVVKTTQYAERLSNILQQSRTRHELHKVYDYISNPKASGYRSIHLVYKYRGAKQQYRDFFVEIQIRSKIQHAWATAVEIIDTYTSQALKASHGQTDWLDFFKYLSAEFSKLENRPIGNHLNNINTLNEVRRLENKLNAINRLNAFAVTTQHISKQKEHKSDYFILELEGDPPTIRISNYPPSMISYATDKYLELEKRAQKENMYDVVLVSASSLNNLKKAYPNYFADSREFIRYLIQVMSLSN